MMAQMAVSPFITYTFMFWLDASLAGPLVNKLKCSFKAFIMAMLLAFSG
jgi:hypothetical protein